MRTCLAREKPAKNREDGTEQVVASHFELWREKIQLHRWVRRRFRILSKQRLGETEFCEQNVSSSQPGSMSGQLSRCAGAEHGDSLDEQLPADPHCRYVSPPPASSTIRLELAAGRRAIHHPVLNRDTAGHSDALITHRGHINSP